ILVDEYQDTDVPQDRIVRALLGDDEDKLFVVGDGKQSIYLFRGADVTIFKGMLRYVEFELKGRKEELGSNYRSTRELVSFINLLFSRIMTCEENEWEFRYHEVQPYRSNDHGSVTLVQVPGGGPDDKLGMARAVADQIDRLVGDDGRMVHWNGNDHLDEPRRPEYGDITILLRARTNLRYYESVLAERGIPYAVEKGVGFFQRQEIMDIGNLVNFLGNQMDDISLYGVLRSPSFGLSDGTLFRVVRSSSYGRLFTKLKRFSDEHPEEARVRKTAAVLNGLLKRSRTVPVSELLNDALQETGVLGVYAGMLGGKQMIANVEQLLDKVRQREQEGFFTLYELKDWMELSVDDSDKEGQAQLEATGDAVRIMTVHASKGLEFPIVILPETQVSPRTDSDQVAMTGIGLFSEVPSVDPMVTYAPVPMRVAATEMRSKSEAQNLRLFYVAATRAKDHFIMLGTRGRKEGAWGDIDEEGRDWFSLTMNGLDIASAEADNGVMEFDGTHPMLLRMEAYDDVAIATMSEGPVPRTVDEELTSWTPDRDVENGGEVKLVLPSAVDGKVEREIKGGVWSETKRLLISRGMDAASYGTLVHEVLRGKSPVTLLSSLHLELGPEEGSVVINGLEQMYERFMSTDLMKQRKVGGMDLQELPFELREGDTLYMGVIDRLVEMECGWALIDYKTISHGNDVIEVVKAFKEQMRVYRSAMEHLIGRDVKCYIYLVESGRMNKI
ncbi:MAG: UvrD-helicase domain-containing protein, partial [Methanomassiliicoccales archaeon]|nr:UvrD-helicase domain-containing protein [Methanomassiliicoccales archaeon]